MKPQTVIMLVVALGCGLAAMVMTQRFLTVPVQDKPKGTMVVVAAIEVKPGEKLAENTVKLVEWPNDVVPANAITKPEEVIGRSVRFPIGANEAVTMAKLAAEGVGPGLEPIIEEGKRAMSVPIKTHESAAGFIKPGSRVDVVMISRGNGDGGKAKTILQNVRVIAVNHSISDNPDEAEKGTVVEMITFLLTPDEAEGLALAQNSGSIQLVLRNPLEDEFVKTKGVTQDELLRGNSRYSELAEKPEDGIKVPEGPSPLSGFLSKLMSAQARKESDAKDQPIAMTPQVAPTPPEMKKRLIYRDLQGNVLMEVILDADDKVVDSLDGLLEDVPPEDTLASLTSPGSLPSLAIPAGPPSPPAENEGAVETP